MKGLGGLLIFILSLSGTIGGFNDIGCRTLPSCFLIKDIYSSADLQEVFLYKDLDFSWEISFSNSKFSKFPSGDFPKLHLITELEAVDVGLIEINQDDLKSFRNLKILDLSQNNIKMLGKSFLHHVPHLLLLNLNRNEITKIDPLAFNKSSDNFLCLDLSFNKLSEISENLFDVVNSEHHELLLQSNAIEKITPASDSIEIQRKFSVVNLSSNKLKSFVYNCTSINTLLLNENQLEDFEIGNCSVNLLDLNDNNFTSLKVSSVTELKISNNVNLQNLNLTLDGLTSLEMKNLRKLVNYESLKIATKLTKLDAANSFLGSLKIDTLADMTSLEFLNLSSTGLSQHIEYGMFSHQKLITNLDISHNNFGSLDIDIFSHLNGLKSLYINGNNLTQLDHLGDIKSIFPRLEEIQIDVNPWNCSYLDHFIKTLDEKFITPSHPIAPVKNSPNVLGIGCVTIKHKNQSINSHKYDMMLLIFVLVLVGIFFGYRKLKRSQNTYIQTRSNNIIYTAVESPFAEEDSIQIN
jgi:Leucine-rich repeat (LRR) protein